VYRIRRATAADAGVLARHRAEMFRDMGELPAGLYDTLIDAARAYSLRPSRTAATWAGSRSWTRRQEKSSAAPDFS